MMKADPAAAGPSAPSDSYETLEGDDAGGLLILADHASNYMPPEYRQLGLPPGELKRHIAYDIGVGPLSRALGQRLNVPVVLSCFSRLLIDPNRGEDDPTLLMRLSDGTVIPGNAHADKAERERRLNRFYRPYHAALDRQIGKMIGGGVPPALFSIHSFTPEWKGARRPWHAGVLWDRDPRFAVPLIEHLRAEAGLRIGDNEPYLGSLKNDTMYRHGTSRGLAHALLEVRNDLIETPGGVEEWADRLEPMLRAICADALLNQIRHYGSSSDEEPTTQGVDANAARRIHAHGA